MPRRGVLTGFTPGIQNTFAPINPNYNSYTSYSNQTIGNKIKRFFNPNFNNNYTNAPNYNLPMINGNYNNLNNKKYIPLFNGTGQGGFGAQSYDGFNLDTNQNYQSGATVTIID